jgi:hypothetical protein
MTQREPARRGSVLGDDFAAAPIAFLRSIGAHRVHHSGGVLLDHLIGTAAILERWGYPEDVCLAGLFHSVYETSTFQNRLLNLDERERVIQVIGESAERTAFHFSQMEQESLWEALRSDAPCLRLRQFEGPLRVDVREVHRLLTLFWANEVEQAHRVPPQVASPALHALIDAARPFLSERAFRDISATWRGATEVVPLSIFERKLFVLEDFYNDINRVFNFSLTCPKRAYTLDFVKAMESVIGYPSQSALQRIKDVLGVREIVDKTDEQSLFGIFRYLMAGDSPRQIGVHVDKQPWTLIVYVSPTIDKSATGIYRHLRTGVWDLGELGPAEREAFVDGPLKEDCHNVDAWECIYATTFKQNTAILFKAQDLLHSNVMTWGDDAQSARITQNFNFQVR